MQPARQIVITGATNGIGQLAAIDLAGASERIGLVARSERKAAETKALLEAAAPGTAVEVFLADLSSMSQVRAVGVAIAERFERIDVLVNNAGIHAFSQRVTADGLPEMVAVNYLAPWLLTRSLIEPLTSGGPSRIVTVASEASRHHGTLIIPEDLTDTKPFSRRESFARYGKTKLLDIMLSATIARRFADTPICANALNPGFNVTGIGRELPFASALERILRRFHVGDPRKGAAEIVRLAVDAALDGMSGQYFSVDKEGPIEPIPPASDRAAQDELWSATENLLGLSMPSPEA
jgi:NAD(P)-dependent dehydrogenase (short-subunit alcohol dehydrogenase family)